ncbi:MAG: TIGR04282 family arsenosugar biosynthesis glycosyltransferase [Acidobacteria bacterium]|nr:TIGR04282 family arsenosugar biosynthesis glycosyltransferase [Acidobacteriota bacterium]
MHEAHTRALRPGGQCALAVMVKAPRSGEVKTRLVPPLTHAEAAAFGSCLLRDTAANISRVATAGVADGLAIYTPVGTEQIFDELLPEGFGLLPQRGAHLGERLFHAVEDLLGLGYTSVCLVNSDTPTLPRSRLTAAIAALGQPGERVVIGPADDGGYYLIGLQGAHARLFEEVEWSTAHVCAQTLERAAEIGLAVELLPSWYDVDDVETLGHLCEELFSENGARLRRGGYEAHNTRGFLAGILEAEGSGRIWPDSPTTRGKRRA